MIQRTRRGFILIIVIGILGVLAMVAVQLSEKSSSAQDIARAAVARSQALFAARSGVEYALKAVQDIGLTTARLDFRGSRGFADSLSFDAVAGDVSGRIDLNDGIAGGLAALGSAYDAAEIDASPGGVFSDNPPAYTTTSGYVHSSGTPNWILVKNTDAVATLTPLIGYQIRVTSGSNSGRIVTITSVAWTGGNAGNPGFPPKIPPTPGYDPGTRIGISTSLTPTNSMAFEVIDPGTYTPGSASLSGWINMRLRRILNAYGDAHKFIAFFGAWPNHLDGGSDTYNGQAFTFTSTDAGDRGYPMPGRDSGGYELTDKATIASSSTGLGDRIIASRPKSGFKSVKDVKAIVDAWGEEWLGNKTFSEIALADFTVHGPLDDKFARVTREFGPYENIDDPFYNRKIYDPTVVTYTPINVVTDPPDLTAILETHPVKTINLNSASRFTRAAVFYALCNVSFLAESSGNSNIVVENSPSTSWNPQELMTGQLTPHIGVAGCAFDPDRMTENDSDDRDQLQANRYMSLRDALCLSAGYGQYLQDVATPMSQFEFRDLLKWYEVNGREYERGRPKGASVALFPYNSNMTHAGRFHQDYVSNTLPELISSTRRLPGFLGAPIALSQTPLRCGGMNDNPELYPLRKAEDLVYRVHLPKVDFLPSGDIDIVSTGHHQIGDHTLDASIHAVIRLFDRQTLRSQADFEQAWINGASNINVGPEFTPLTHASGANQDPNEFLGFIGLWDTETTKLGNPKIVMNFNKGSMEPGYESDGPANYHPPTRAEDDPSLQAASEPSTIYPRWKDALRDSEIEDANRPVFTKGGSMSSISPFGGVRLTSWGHGANATASAANGTEGDLFNDTLYWSLYDKSGNVPAAAQTPFNGTQYVADIYGKGHIDFWVQIPPGQDYMERGTIHPSGKMNAYRSICQIRLFDKHFISWSTTLTNLEPINLTVMLRRSGKDWSKNTIIALLNTDYHNAKADDFYHEHIPLQFVPGDQDPNFISFMGLPKDETGRWYLHSGSYFDRYGIGSILTLKDIPENGPGSWHRISVGWDLNYGTLTGSQYAENALWIRGRGGDSRYNPWSLWGSHKRLSHFDVGDYIQYLQNRPGSYTKYWTKSEAMNEWHNYMSSEYGHAALVLGEFFYRQEVQMPGFRLDSCVDNFQIHFGSNPYTLNSPAYTDPSNGSDPTLRYDVSGSPGVELATGIPVNSRIFAIRGIIYHPPDSSDNFPSCELTLDDGTAEILADTRSTDERTAFFNGPAIDSNTRLKLTWQDHAPTFDGDLTTNKPLVNDMSDSWSAIPWAKEFNIIYRDPKGIRYISWLED